MERPDWVEVGRVSRAHGVHGEVRVLVVSDNPERFAAGSVVYAHPAKLPKGSARTVASSCMRQRLEIEYVRGGGRLLIVAFLEVSGRAEADALRGHVLEVPGAELPPLPEDEFYLFELKGLEVRDETGACVGEVVRVLEYPSQEVLEVELAAGMSVLVPFTLEAVPEVDTEQGRLVVARAFLASESTE